jgi:hypothetical protein
VKVQTVYTDTSVFGGVFDDEFSMPSRAFFDLIEGGRFRIVASDILRREILLAPGKVISFFESMLKYIDFFNVSDEILQLQNAYLSAGIVSE